jgi:hypothetical protein
LIRFTPCDKTDCFKVDFGDFRWGNLRAHLLLGLVFVLTIVLDEQPVEMRIAVVVGNDDYQAGKLGTTANDTGLVADALQAASRRTGSAAAAVERVRQTLTDTVVSGPDRRTALPNGIAKSDGARRIATANAVPSGPVAGFWHPSVPPPHPPQSPGPPGPPHQSLHENSTRRR